MNIFYLDENPSIAARWLDNTRVTKMILESAQLMATAHHVLDGEKKPKGNSFIFFKDGFPIKATHINHPCTKWVRLSHDNYLWLYEHFEALLKEFEVAYEHPHSYCQHRPLLMRPPIAIESLGLTAPAQAMPDIYKNDNPVEAYRAYFKGEKLSKCRWNDKRKNPWI